MAVSRLTDVAQLDAPMNMTALPITHDELEAVQPLGKVSDGKFAQEVVDICQFGSGGLPAWTSLR